MMTYSISEAIDLLARTPAVLDVLLRDLPDPWIKNNEGPKTWSPFDVLGHLIHGEKTDWMVRTRLILEDSQTPFEPFDRFAQIKESQGKTMQDLLNEFKDLREQNLIDLQNLSLSEDQLAKKGVHPEFGDITCRQLLAAWVVHDQGHIVQVSRVMAKQYTEEVGPWTKYLTVLGK